MPQQPHTHTSPLTIGSGRLSLHDLIAVARHDCPVAPFGPGAGDAWQRAEASRAWVAAAVARLGDADAPAYYGINTGFGSKSGRQPLGASDLPWVQRNLILSHSTGLGDPLPPDVVRATLLIRAHSLAQGYSGVRPILINTLVALLNSGIVPVIPEYGSLGASGDLIPLSHLALLISATPPDAEDNGPLPADYQTAGEAWVPLDRYPDVPVDADIATLAGRRYARLPGDAALALAGIAPLVLAAKEGLALNNGTTVSTAIAALALADARNALNHAHLAAAMSLEALLGFGDALLPQVHALRGHAGQQAVAAHLRALTAGSTLLDGDAATDPRRVPPQDPYSLRVVPVVHGAVSDTLDFIEHTVLTELNAVTDNPLIFDLAGDHPLHLPRSYRAVSGANFHGAPLAYVLDLLSIVMTDLGSLSERRTFRLTDPKLNRGLPPMLIDDPPGKPGRTSGLMLPQYLAAALVSDCKTLAHPDSVDSLTSSANQEDHVSMSMNAARHARQVVANVERIVAIELLSAATGLRCRLTRLSAALAGQLTLTDAWDVEVLDYLQATDQPPRPGNGTGAALAAIEATLYPPGSALPVLSRPAAAEDRFLQPYLLRVLALLQRQTML